MDNDSDWDNELISNLTSMLNDRSLVFLESRKRRTWLHDNIIYLEPVLRPRFLEQSLPLSLRRACTNGELYSSYTQFPGIGMYDNASAAAARAALGRELLGAGLCNQLLGIECGRPRA